MIPFAVWGSMALLSSFLFVQERSMIRLALGMLASLVKSLAGHLGRTLARLGSLVRGGILRCSDKLRDALNYLNERI